MRDQQVFRHFPPVSTHITASAPYSPWRLMIRIRVLGCAHILIHQWQRARASMKLQPSTTNRRSLVQRACARTDANTRHRRGVYGGMVGWCGGRQMARLLRASEWRRRTSAQKKICSCAHCASDTVLRFLINVPCLSQSHQTCPPTSISARRRRRRVQILQKLSWSTASLTATPLWQ